MKPIIETHAKLLELITYNPITGVIYRPDGKVGGTPNGGSGYRRISIANRSYYEHRVIWFYMTGAWPTKQIDHINTLRHDNRWENLREADASENGANRRLLKANTTGLKGVICDRGYWRASIRKNGKKTWLGIFPSKEDAHAAYVRAAESTFGKFARIH